MYGNLSDTQLVKQGIAPQAVAAGATVQGGGIDCLGYETQQVVVEMGAIVSGANKTVTVKLQESSDNNVADAWADVASATTGAIANAGQNEPYIVDVNLSEVERYLQAVATGGSSDGGLVSATFVLAKGREAPPTQVNTVVRIGYS